MNDDGNDNTPQPEDGAAETIREDQGGWISGPALPEADYKLAALRQKYPRWTFWHGKHTGSYWAMPPPGMMGLLNADDLETLERRVLDVESWEQTGE